MLQMSQRYDTIAAQLHKKPKGVRKGRYTLGDEVALLPCSAKADALLFLHSAVNILTGGKQAFGILVAGPKYSASRLYLAFVDARSGEVLAFTSIVRGVGTKFRNDPEAVYRDVLTRTSRRCGSARRA